MSPAAAPCTQGLCWLTYTPTYSGVPLPWHISLVCSDRHVDVQQEQGWRRQEGRKGDELLSENCCLSVVFLVCAGQSSFNPSYCLPAVLSVNKSWQGLTWVCWAPLPARATQTRLICDLDWRRKGEGHVEACLAGEDQECTPEKGA